MFLYIILLLMCSWCSVAPACGPVEEGQSTTLTCYVNTSGCPSGGFVLEWRAQTATQEGQVIRCRPAQCGGGFSPQYVSATISPTSSTLTINSVSRTDPINMETKWLCAPCSPRPAVTVCDKLEIYAKPFSPSCIVTEDTNSGSEDVESVTLVCSSGRVYPRAKCSLYKKTNGGSFDKITKTQTVSSTSVSSNPVYYSASCSVTLTLQELGEGTHSFTGYIYPDVTDGQRLVTGTPVDRDVTYSFSQVSHTCTTNIVQGYFARKSARCTCSITSAGNPRGTAQWYRGDNTVGTAGELDVTDDRNNSPEVTFTGDPAMTTFNKGDRVRFTCSAEGNPDPGLTLTRQRTGEVLIKVQTLTLTYTLDFLECLDTGVYVCSGKNIQGTDSKDIKINVQCPQQFRPAFDPPRFVDAVVGGTAHFHLEIYGFPEPVLMSLQKTDSKDVWLSSPRHTLNYAVTDLPLGTVTVNIFDIIEAESTNFTLTIDNGVGDPLLYTFYLNIDKRVKAMKRTEEDTSKTIAVTVGVIAVVIITSLAVIIVFLVKKIRTSKQDSGRHLIPMKTTGIMTTSQKPENPRPGVYEDIDGVENTNSLPISAGVAPVPRQDTVNNDKPPTTQSAIFSASQPPETAQYETPSDLFLPSGPYDSTSAQDMELPNIYNRPRADTSSTGHDTQFGQYINMPGQQ